MNDKLIKVGITHGDINGIAYELILKTFEDVRIFESCIPVVYGSPKILAYHRKVTGLPPVNVNTINNAREIGINRLNIMNCGGDEAAVDFSGATPASEQLSLKAFQKAISDLEAGGIDALLMAPSNRNENFLEEIQAGKEEKPLKMLVHNSFRIALASNKIPLAGVPSHLTADSLARQIQQLQTSLIHDFMITLPRIAVLSMNPGVGIKEQQYGQEENEIILPAIKAANDAGVVCFGPYSAGNFFETNDHLRFDAILAMYYDQGFIPFQTGSFGQGVSYFADLPFVVTSSIDGVSYDKAGKNESSEASFRNALYLAIDLVKTRALDKKIYANPLKKQYFERGSDNEKLDLTKDEE